MVRIWAGCALRDRGRRRMGMTWKGVVVRVRRIPLIFRDEGGCSSREANEVGELPTHGSEECYALDFMADDGDQVERVLELLR